jgi:hypothetical protein
VPLLKPPLPQLPKSPNLRARPVTRAHVSSPIACLRRLGTSGERSRTYAAIDERPVCVLVEPDDNAPNGARDIRNESLPLLLGRPEPGPDHSVAAFGHCDSASNSLLAFVSHLENHQPLLRHLPAFEIYAVPSAAKFHRAEAFFTRLFAPTRRVTTQHLCRYFTVRQLWEIGQTSQLTRIAGWRSAVPRPIIRPRVSGVGGQRLFRHEVSALVNPGSEQQKMAFKTHLQPESYDILDHVSINKNRGRSGTIRGNAHSTKCSAPSSTSSVAQALENPGTTPWTSLSMRTREKTFCGRERPRILARVSRQNPFGRRGSLPATVCSPRGRASRSSRVRIRANSCPSRPTLLTCAIQVQPRRSHASTKAT